MATTLTYRDLPQPYDNNMNRTDPASSVPQDNETAFERAKTGSLNTDLWLNTWMKSTNYKPKNSGFLIDGQKGYIECMDFYTKNITVNMVGTGPGWDTTGADFIAGGVSVVKINVNGIIIRNEKGLSLEDVTPGNFFTLYQTDAVAGTVTPTYPQGQGRTMMFLSPLNRFYIKKYSPTLDTSVDSLFTVSDDRLYSARDFYIDAKGTSPTNSNLKFGYSNGTVDTLIDGNIYVGLKPTDPSTGNLNIYQFNNTTKVAVCKAIIDENIWTAGRVYADGGLSSSGTITSTGMISSSGSVQAGGDLIATGNLRLTGNTVQVSGGTNFYPVTFQFKNGAGITKTIQVLATSSPY